MSQCRNATMPQCHNATMPQCHNHNVAIHYVYHHSLCDSNLTIVFVLLYIHTQMEHTEMPWYEQYESKSYAFVSKLCTVYDCQKHINLTGYDCR